MTDARSGPRRALPAGMKCSILSALGLCAPLLLLGCEDTANRNASNLSPVADELSCPRTGTYTPTGGVQLTNVTTTISIPADLVPAPGASVTSVDASRVTLRHGAT